MTKISIRFYNDREDSTKQLVSKTHELFVFFEVVSVTNQLRRLSGSWLVALTN